MPGQAQLRSSMTVRSSGGSFVALVRKPHALSRLHNTQSCFAAFVGAHTRCMLVHWCSSVLRHHYSDTHAHWWKPDISWRSHTIKCTGGLLTKQNYAISLTLCPKKTPLFLLMNLHFNCSHTIFSNVLVTIFLKLPNIQRCKNIQESLFPTSFTKQYIDCIHQSYPFSSATQTCQVLDRNYYEPRGSSNVMHIIFQQFIYIYASFTNFQLSGRETFSHQ